jgi:predicted nucleic acid-binding protein
MSGRVFFDTNVLVYANDSSDTNKQRKARDLIKSALLNRTAVISVQVLSEFWVTVTKKIENPLPDASAEKEIEIFELMDIVNLDIDLFKDAVKFMKLHRLSFWDSLIIAAALFADCKVLFTEDLSDGQLIRGMRIKNPFT